MLTIYKIIYIYYIKACPTNCKSCDASYCFTCFDKFKNSACDECAPGYYNSSSICLPCMDNCEVCSDSISCTTCVDGYTGTNCDECTANTHFTTNDGKCERCDPYCSSDGCVISKNICCTDTKVNPSCTGCNPGFVYSE